MLLTGKINLHTNQKIKFKNNRKKFSLFLNMTLKNLTTMEWLVSQEYFSDDNSRKNGQKNENSEKFI